MSEIRYMEFHTVAAYLHIFARCARWGTFSAVPEVPGEHSRNTRPRAGAKNERYKI